MTPVRSSHRDLSAFRPPEVVGDTLFVLPSTTKTVSLVAGWRESAPNLLVAGPQVSGGMDSMQLLAHLRGTRGSAPTIAIVFTDQLVSSIDAPVLVDTGGTTSYFSALESIAHLKYGFDLQVWLGETFEPPPVAASNVDVLRLLLKHLIACERLGQAWLMRAAQARKRPEQRLDEVRMRLRLFQSAMMYAIPTQPLPPEWHRIASKVMEIDRHVRT